MKACGVYDSVAAMPFLLSLRMYAHSSRDVFYLDTVTGPITFHGTFYASRTLIAGVCKYDDVGKCVELHHK